VRPMMYRHATTLVLGAVISGNLCVAFSSIQFISRAAARNKTFIAANPTALGSMKNAGDSFVSLSKLLDPPSASSFQSAGDALLQAHASWTVDWAEVTMALADAATSFSRISDQFSESNSAASDLYQKISLELEDASNISGCISIGPPSSVPNLEAIRDHLLELSELEDEDVHSPTASAHLLEAFQAITSLIKSID
jgi:hypothetical protein